MGDWRVKAVSVELMCKNGLFLLVLLHQPAQIYSLLWILPTFTYNM